MSSSRKDFNKMKTAASPSSGFSVDDYLQRCFQGIDDLANNPYVNGTLQGPDEGTSGPDHRGSIQESPMPNSTQKSHGKASRREKDQYLDVSRSSTPKGSDRQPMNSRSTTPVPLPPKHASESSSKSMKSAVDHMHLPPATAKSESKPKGFKAFMRMRS